MKRKVALFVPCFVDQVLPQVAIDTLTVLRRVGCDVVFPEDQTCCGQPGFNTGHWEAALPCAERFVRVFSGYDCIVCPSGSCTSMVRSHYPELLASSPLRQDAIDVGQRVFEFSEFLVRFRTPSPIIPPATPPASWESTPSPCNFCGPCVISICGRCPMRASAAALAECSPQNSA